MAEIDIRFQQTPNPNAGKFVVTGKRVVEGPASRSYFSAADAAGDPLAEPLMALDGVTNVFMVDDFVTVTKARDADWRELAPRVEAILRERL